MLPGLLQQGEGLRAVTVRSEMESDNETGFTVDHQPKVVLHVGDLDDCFIRVPFIGVKIQHGKQL